MPEGLPGWGYHFYKSESLSSKIPHDILQEGGLSLLPSQHLEEWTSVRRSGEGGEKEGRIEGGKEGIIC